MEKRRPIYTRGLVHAAEKHRCQVDSTSSTRLVSNTITQYMKPGLLGEVADWRTGAAN